MSSPLSSLVKDGDLDLPAGPGWGVEIDEDEQFFFRRFQTWIEQAFARCCYREGFPTVRSSRPLRWPSASSDSRESFPLA
jgi:hypothetical protein